MTRQEIIDSIGVNYAILGDAIPVWEVVRLPENVMLYQQICYRLIGESVQEDSIYFYVRDEGLPAEAAYLRAGQENKISPAVDVFTNRINTLIESHIQSGAIEGVFDIKNIDTENNTAVILAMVEEGSNLITKRYFIDEDENGDLQYRQFGG